MNPSITLQLLAAGIGMAPVPPPGQPVGKPADWEKTNGNAGLASNFAINEAALGTAFRKWKIENINGDAALWLFAGELPNIRWLAIDQPSAQITIKKDRSIALGTASAQHANALRGVGRINIHTHLLGATINVSALEATKDGPLDLCFLSGSSRVNLGPKPTNMTLSVRCQAQPSDGGKKDAITPSVYFAIPASQLKKATMRELFDLDTQTGIFCPYTEIKFGGNTLIISNRREGELGFRKVDAGIILTDDAGNALSTVHIYNNGKIAECGASGIEEELRRPQKTLKAEIAPPPRIPQCLPAPAAPKGTKQR